MEIDLSQFHQVFFEESQEGLDVMEAELLELEEDSDLENINTIFRAAHSIKGGSGTFGFKEVAEFTHVLETLLDEMRDGTRAVTKDIVDLLLKSVDCLRTMFSKIQEGEAVGESHLELLGYFNELLNGEESTDETSESEQADDLPASNSGIWSISFKPASYILQTGNEPSRMFRELEELGELKSTAVLENVPDFDALNPEECHIWWQLELNADVPEEAIREVFEWVEDDCELEINRKDSDNSSPLEETETSPAMAESTAHEQSDAIDPEDNKESNDSTEPPKSRAISKSAVELTRRQAQAEKSKVKKAASSIRVGTDKVDQLIDLVGELVITQSMLSELGDNFDATRINQLVAGLAELEQNTRELQESVMRIRMLPIGFVFNRLPRMVRDLSSQLNKQVHLEIKGESTELDKTVLEQIGDPLTHLVRNALDHGIESSADRLEKGKNAEGTLTLNAYHQGGNIVIEISDDGAGINPEVIYQKAVEKGLITEGVELPHEQILGLIMEPGFSTATVVSDVSGRGVGMDVVKRNINELGGSVEIDSEYGKGTTFTIRLPLTLAILEGQLIRVGEEIFVLPLVSIIESIPVRYDSLKQVAGNLKVYKFDDEYVPVVNLQQEFELQSSVNANNNGVLTIVSNENRKLGIMVDELLGQQQVVIKSLETHYMSIQGVSGATILGNGRVALILDVSGLARRTSINKSGPQSEVA